MKGKFAIILALLVLMAFFAAACTVTNESEQVEEPKPTVEPTPQPTPEPTAPPVTRQDIPAQWLPGISEIGAVPTREYKIGMIVEKTDGSDAWQSEIDAMSAAYEARFGVQIVTVQTESVPAVQAQAVADMVRQGIDFLIISPCADNVMHSVGQACKNNGIPYITMGNRIDAVPGQDGYVCAIEHDDYMTGVLTGLSIVDKMTHKYGRPKGNIAEITDTVDSEAAQLRSMGIRRVLDAYDELGVVCCMIGGDTDDMRYTAASNVLKAFRKNELDGVVADSDATAIQTLQAVLDTDRDEMIGSIWSMEAGKDGLIGVWHGQFVMAVERTAHTGMVAIEFALQYLEGSGEDVPPVVTSITRVFAADTQEQKDGIARLIAAMEQRGTDAIFDSMGEYAAFMPDAAGLGSVYPKPYYAQTDVDAYLAEFEPFATSDAIYDVVREED